MTRVRQVALGVLTALALAGARAEPEFEWKPLEIGAGRFGGKLGMLARERQEYAENLAVHAANGIARERASEASLERARRLLAVSLHLAPRNRPAIVTNYQLWRGVLPAEREGDYSAEVMAGLLFTRAELLRGQAGAENAAMARIFTELAAELDPRNEDAVYEAELQRLELGPLKWQALVGVRAADGGGAVPP